MEKPPSAYNIFMKTLKEDADFQKHLEQQSSLRPKFIEEASKRWNTLTEEQKQPFYDQVRRMKEKYELYQQ